jgi:hypothetical protein
MGQERHGGVDEHLLERLAADVREFSTLVSALESADEVLRQETEGQDSQGAFTAVGLLDTCTHSDTTENAADVKAEEGQPMVVGRWSFSSVEMARRSGFTSTRYGRTRRTLQSRSMRCVKPGGNGILLATNLEL